MPVLYPKPYTLNPRNGYTLLELLIVIVIIGILSSLSFVYYNSLSSDKQMQKAVDSVQTFLRTAQSNATSGFNCSSIHKGATSWFISFRDKSGIDLDCVDPETKDGILVRTLTFENNVQIESLKCYGNDNTNGIQFDQSNPILVSYSPLYGKVTFSGGDNCLDNAFALTITLNNANSSTSFNVSKGGAINVQ